MKKQSIVYLVMVLLLCLAGTVLALDIAPDPSGTYGFQLDLAPLSLPDGSYTVRANASNMWGTSNWSTSYPFDKSAAGVPVNIRLVPSP